MESGHSNPHALDTQLDALRHGHAFADLSSWWKTSVGGEDAIGWLHDLLTADIASLLPGMSRRSLLLTPTGRIRADVHLARSGHDLFLLQAPCANDPVARLLAPYVLSSDVRLDDVTDVFALLAVPGAGGADSAATSFAPSVLGAGHDEILPAGPPAVERRAALTAGGLVEATAEAVEIDRIRRGVARMGNDFDESSLPAEAGLDALIDATKGCFLGQESVARVRDLGHPPRVLRRVRTDGVVRVGEPVRVGDREVGQITSAAAGVGHDSVAITRVGWEAREDELALDGGRRLVDVPQIV